MLPTGKTEYKSVTTVDDATAEEFHDFFLDDPARLQWDPLLTRAHVVETGGQGDRRQVVHWVRSFPFSFIKERDYVIARRTFVGSDGAIYGITKSCRHPRALPSGQVGRAHGTGASPDPGQCPPASSKRVSASPRRSSAATSTTRCGGP